MKSLIKHSHLLILAFFNVLVIIESQSFCNKRIYDPTKFFSLPQIKILCLSIQTSKFIVSIQKNPSDSNSLEDTKRQFSSLCGFLNICKSGVMISVYIPSKKIIIYSGSKVKTSLSTERREQIILKERDLLIKGDFYHALINIVSTIKRELPETSDSVIKRYFGSKTTNNDIHSSGIWIAALILGLVSAIVYLLCCCCFISNIVSERWKNSLLDKINNEDYITQHIYFLSNILCGIKKTPERTLEISSCLVCMEDLFSSQNRVKTSERRFECGHLFHYKCIQKYNECLMCKGLISTPSIVTPVINLNHEDQLKTNLTPCNINSNYTKIPNDYNTNPFVCTVTEREVVNFLNNFSVIYDQHELKDYYKKNPQEVEAISKEHGLSMWGLAAGVAGGVAVGGLVGYGIGTYVNSGHEEHHILQNNNHQEFNPFKEEEDDFNGDAAEEGW